MKKLLRALFVLFFLVPTICTAMDVGLVEVQEVDSSPKGFAWKLIFPNGSVSSVTGGVATITAINPGPTGPAAPVYSTTSSTSKNPASITPPSSQSFTVVVPAAGLAYVGGEYVTIASAANPTTKNFYGQVTSYTAGTGALVVNITTANGSGAATDWVVGLSGPAGASAVAHNLLSATHTDATAASVTRGALISGQGASPSWTLLSAGAQYSLLQMGANEPGWTSISSNVNSILGAANYAAIKTLLGYPTTSADVIGLWASGSCSGYLKSDGTCSTPSGTMTYPANTGFTIVTSGASWGTTIKAGTMTDGDWCKYTTASGLACDQTAPTASMVYPTGSGIAQVSSGTSWGTTLTLSTDSALGTSDTTISSQKAVKSYVDTATAAIAVAGTDGNYGMSVKDNTSAMAVASGYASIFGSVAHRPSFQYGTRGVETLAVLGANTFIADQIISDGIYIKSDTTNAHTFSLAGRGNGGWFPVLTITNNTSGLPSLSFIDQTIDHLNIKDQNYAYDLHIQASSSVTQTANRTLTLDTGNTSPTFALKKNLTIQTGNVTFTGDASGSSVTLPTSGTLQTTTGSPAGFIISSQAAGDLLYASSSSAWTRLGVGTDNYVLTVSPSTHLPVWAASAGGVASLASGTTLTAGSVYYHTSTASGSNGDYALAKADAAGTSSQQLLCVADTTSTCMDIGSYTSSGTWTPGAPLYLSAATGGLITATAPSTAGQFVCQIGNALTTTVIRVNPKPCVGL